jgi:hypothetical protein
MVLAGQSKAQIIDGIKTFIKQELPSLEPGAMSPAASISFVDRFEVEISQIHVSVRQVQTNGLSPFCYRLGGKGAR